jgi:lysophospholipase L1-like esterase
VKKLKDILKNLALLVGSLLFLFVVLEIGTRIIFGNQPVFIYPQVIHVTNAEYGHKFKPNQRGTYTLDKPVYTNSFGFRDYEWDMPKPADRIRIMCLGDSLTFGNGARGEDTYPKVLERKLKKLDANIEVISTAVSGWSLYNYVDFFKKEGTNYQPDIVIIGFYPNDYGPRPDHYNVKLTEDGRWDARPIWIRWLPYKYIFLLKRSALVTYLRDRIGNIKKGEKDFITLLLENEVDLDRNKAVADGYSLILEMKEICDEKGINKKIVLASIPPINSFWVPKGSFDYNNHLESFCKSNDITFIDLAEGFWRVKNTNKLYMYPWDNHLRPEGHKLVANQLYDLMLKLVKK